MSRIYEPHSENYSNAQYRFVANRQYKHWQQIGREQQQRQQALEQQVKRTQRRVKLARIFTLLAVVSFCVLGGGAVAIFGQFSADPVNRPTQAAIVINTPRPTDTLQSPTWAAVQAEQTNPTQPGYVVVPDGFWQVPGMVEAYRAGTPVAELVAQYEQSEPVQAAPVTNPVQVIATPTLDPRIEQAKSDLEVAQIRAQIDISQTEALAAQRVTEAKAEQEIARNQLISQRISWLIEIVIYLFLIGGGFVLLRFLGLPLIGWLFDGLVDWLGNRAETLRFWIAELRQPDTAEPEQPALSEHLRNLPINHHGSARRQELAQQREQLADITDAEILTVLSVWDQSQNMSECQRQAFGVTNTGGGAFRKVERILQTYRPGYNTPTPPPALTPYLGNTTQ